MTPEMIAKQILARRTLARGVVVLEKPLWDLEPALKDANIRVIKVSPSPENDQYIKTQLLPHRIIVTMNAADFLDEAPIEEYGVISLETLGSIDSSRTYRQNKTVQLLSKVMSRYSLWEKGAKFLLELRDNGNHTLSELT